MIYTHLELFLDYSKNTISMHCNINLCVCTNIIYIHLNAGGRCLGATGFRQSVAPTIETPSINKTIFSSYIKVNSPQRCWNKFMVKKWKTRQLPLSCLSKTSPFIIDYFEACVPGYV